jgi:hypothetical protein
VSRVVSAPGIGGTDRTSADSGSNDHADLALSSGNTGSGQRGSWYYTRRVEAAARRLDLKMLRGRGGRSRVNELVASSAQRRVALDAG